MNLLITGAAGFVASSLISVLQNQGYLHRFENIVGIDNFAYGYRERLNDLLSNSFTFIEQDINNTDKVIRALNSLPYDIDSIVNCAAIAPLPECEIDHQLCITNNVITVASIMSIASHFAIKKVIHFSSGAIYEGTVIFPTPESAAIATRLAYPTSKHLSELYLASFARSHNVHIYSLRLFNLYGPRQDYFRKQPPLVGYLIKCLLTNTNPILYSDGEQQRDYIFILDLVKIIISILDIEEVKDTHFTPLNVGSGKAVSVNTIIKTLEVISSISIDPVRRPSTQYWDKYETLYNKKIPLSRVVVAEEVTKYSQACIVRLSEYIDTTSLVTLESGLRQCYDHAITIFKQ